MPYERGSLERGLLDDDPRALAQVSRWISMALTSTRFWSIRNDWLDLHQETLARVIESLRQERYDSTRDLRTYVQGVARHTASQAIARRMQSMSDRAAAGWPDTTPVDPENRAANRQIARRVLDQASEECRDLIRAYFYDDRGYAEIAEALDVPIGTIKSRLFRCLEAAYLSLHGMVRRRNQRPSMRNKALTEDPE